MPSHFEDLDRGMGGSRQCYDSRARRTCITWYHVIVPSVVLLLTIFKVVAAMNGDDFKSNILDLTISVGISGAGSCILFVIKDMKIRAFYWFFEDDCRGHIRAGFEWVCTLSVGLLNKRRYSETLDLPLLRFTTQWRLQFSLTTRLSALLMPRKGRSSPAEIDRHTANQVLDGQAAARASIELMDLTSTRAGSSSPGNQNIELPEAYVPPETELTIREFLQELIRLGEAAPVDASTMWDVGELPSESEATVTPGNPTQTPSIDTSEPVVPTQHDEMQKISRSTGRPVVLRVLHNNWVSQPVNGMEFRGRLIRRLACGNCRKARVRCARSSIEGLPCGRCSARDLPCVTTKRDSETRNGDPDDA